MDKESRNFLPPVTGASDEAVRQDCLDSMRGGTQTVEISQQCNKKAAYENILEWDPMTGHYTLSESVTGDSRRQILACLRHAGYLVV